MVGHLGSLFGFFDRETGESGAQGRHSSEETRFLTSRPAASTPHLPEAGDDRNLDQTMGAPPGSPLYVPPRGTRRHRPSLRYVTHAFACGYKKVA